MTDEHTTNSTRRIEIPERTAQALEARLDRSEFESIDAYAAFGLELLIREIDNAQTDTQHGDAPDRDESEDDGLEEQLESLGYL